MDLADAVDELEQGLVVGAQKPFVPLIAQEERADLDLRAVSRLGRNLVNHRTAERRLRRPG